MAIVTGRVLMGHRGLGSRLNDRRMISFLKTEVMSFFSGKHDFGVCISACAIDMVCVKGEDIVTKGFGEGAIGPD